MRVLIKAALTLGVVALVAGPVMAQPRQGGRGGMQGGIAGLVANASVQKELKLNDEQIEKIKKFSAEAQTKMREAFQGLGDLSQEERREKMTAMFKKMTEEATKALGDILKPEQMKRLKQISLQQQGVGGSMNDADVQKALNLTDDQKEKIKAIQSETAKEMQEIRRGSQDDREGAAKKMQELGKASKAKIVAVLTDSQKSAWKELTGEPFEVKMEPRQGGGRRQRQ